MAAGVAGVGDKFPKATVIFHLSLFVLALACSVGTNDLRSELMNKILLTVLTLMGVFLCGITQPAQANGPYGEGGCDVKAGNQPPPLETCQNASKATQFSVKGSGYQKTGAGTECASYQDTLNNTQPCGNYYVITQHE